ncbi:MAG: hypothetical protein E7640_05330 [Ruminococcaceae bacterium]|nr:hypothetical protein [Oscillospiraceae bacterium]
MANKNFSEKRLRAKIASEYASLENFRPRADGGIEKRAGREKINEFPANIYSAVEFSMSRTSENSDGLLIAAPPYVYEYKISNRQARELMFDPDSSTEHMGIATQGAYIYCFNGSGVKVYDEEISAAFFDCEGYAPLYGKAWDPELRGSVYEERNLLCGNIRINYSVKEAATSLSLGFYPRSIVRVEIDGVSTNDFTLDKDRITGNFPANTSVDVWLVISHYSSQLTNCRSVCKLSDERFVAYNSRIAPNQIFLSSPVSPEALEASKIGFPSGDSLYFPQSSKTSLKGTVTAIAACFDKMVIFTNQRAWLGDIKEGSLEMCSVCDYVGCVDPRAVLCRGTDVYTISEIGAFKLSLNFNEPSETKAELLFEVPQNFGDGGCSVFINPPESEILFSCGGQIFVYNTLQKRIHSYPDMSAVYGKSRKGETIILEGNSAWRFSDSLDFDVNASQEIPISAVASTEWIDFGESEVEKRTLTVHPVFTLKDDGYFELLIETDSGLYEKYKISAKGGNIPRYKSIRIALCRFKSVRLSVISSGKESPRIFDIVLTALEGRN